MAYFRNKTRAAAAEIIEPENNNIPVEKLPDEDALQRKAPQLEASAAAPPEAPTEPPQAEQQAEPQDSDAASQVLRAQVEALQRSEQLAQQRQAAAIDDQRRAEWLQNTPAAQANYGALGPLHHEALRAGFDDLSPEYFHYLESGLAALAQPPQEQEPHSEAQPMSVERPAVAPPAAAAEPAPKFFRPPVPRMPSPRPVAVSAPVSRSIPSSDRERIETNPSSVRLSAAELEIAKSAGISVREYAEGKLRLEKEKRQGLRQNG